MDYKEFVTLVKEKLSSMNETDKDNWIYAYARQLDSNYREHFLNSLDTSSKEISYDIDEYLKMFEKIENEEIYLNEHDEEYYDEIYHDWEYSPRYIDVFKVLPKIEECIRICYEIILSKQYKRAYTLLSYLKKMKILYVNDETGDLDYLYLEDLIYYDLLEMDIKEFYLAYLYCAININENSEIIFNIYSKYKGSDLHIDDILAYSSEEIKNIQLLIKKICEYLLYRPGDKEDQFLIEGALYLGGQDELLNYARKTYKIHPSLYKKYCELALEPGNHDLCIQVAKEAIEKIPEYKTIRADIADVAVEAQSDDPYFYEVAFLSKPTVLHCLRLYTGNTNISQIKNRFLANCYQIEKEFPNELKEVYLNEHNVKIYRFLLGDYKEIYQECVNDKTYLGWSLSLKGTIIPLLLMLLKESDCIYYADRHLMSDLQSRLNVDLSKCAIFEKYFQEWKSKFQLDESFKEECLKWLLHEIDQRTEVIVGGTYRKSYYKCANQIIVLGEILENKGRINSVNEFVDNYIKIHARKRAFKKEILDGIKKY